MDQFPTIDRLPQPALDVRPGTGTPEQVKALAAQFESMLISQMLKQVRASMFEEDESAADTAPLADTLFAELSLAISRSRGLGLTDALVAPLLTQTGADAGVAAAPVSPVDLAGPALAGRVSSAYGWRRDPIDNSMKFHRGVDLALPLGTEVPAPRPGTVTFAGEQTGYGLTVVVDHGGGLTTRVAHLSAIRVKVGDQVAAGDVLGQVGATGRATGPHLHLEVKESGQNVNPLEMLGNHAPRPISQP